MSGVLLSEWSDLARSVYSIGYYERFVLQSNEPCIAQVREVYLDMSGVRFEVHVRYSDEPIPTVFLGRFTTVKEAKECADKWLRGVGYRLFEESELRLLK